MLIVAKEQQVITEIDKSNDMLAETKQTTELGKSYWSNNGVYQKQYDELYEQLVPSSGESDTIHGEMIRAVSRLYYDFCNNGNCNVIEIERDTCQECGGSGYVDNDDEDGIEDCYWCEGQGTEEGDIVIDEYYQEMIDFLENNMENTKSLDVLIDFLEDKSLGYGKYSFDDKQMKIYNDLVDAVMYQVINSENQKIV